MKRRNLLSFTLFAFLCVILSSCEKEYRNPEHVFIVYSCGYNNLSYALRSDINELVKSPQLCTKTGPRQLVVLSHTTKAYGNYSTEMPPALVHIYKTKKGEVVRDTLATFPGRTGSDASLLREVLVKVHNHFNAKDYGFLFSSHGTGWLPFNYYNKGASKTIGSDFGPGSVSKYEMDVADFAAAFPYKMKYVLMDACYSSGVEFYYQMRNVSDYIIASPSEILDDGMVYTNMLESLFKASGPDLMAIAKEYMRFYREDAYNKIASIAYVDCSKLDNLASVCRMMFEKYRTQMQTVDEKTIQAYFRRDDRSPERHWFYDLEHIFIRCGASEADLETLHRAIGQAVLFADHTDVLFDGRRVVHSCGLSMYLPQVGNEYLDAYYKPLDWNKATNLVQ